MLTLGTSADTSQNVNDTVFPFLDLFGNTLHCDMCTFGFMQFPGSADGSI